jgi:hypothetical protein
MFHRAADLLEALQPRQARGFGDQDRRTPLSLGYHANLETP